MLLKEKLIKIERSEVEAHGILQKYYVPASTLFIEDFEKVPSESLLALSTSAYACFLHINMERLMGALSVFQLIKETHGRNIEISSEQLEELALEFARHLAHVGRKYEEEMSDMSRETLSIKIYSEALNRVMTQDKWKKFFGDITNLGLTYK